MSNNSIPDEKLDAVSGGEGVSKWDEAALVALIIAAKLQDMTLAQFLEKHPHYAADPDHAAFITEVWNRS